MASPSSVEVKLVWPRDIKRRKKKKKKKKKKIEKIITYQVVFLQA